MNIEELFRNIEQSDFNDNYYCILAATEDIKIVTDDHDFASTEKTRVPILTANYKLLKGS